LVVRLARLPATLRGVPLFGCLRTYTFTLLRYAVTVTLLVYAFTLPALPLRFGLRCATTAVAFTLPHRSLPLLTLYVTRLAVRLTLPVATLPFTVPVTVDTRLHVRLPLLRLLPFCLPLVAGYRYPLRTAFTTPLQRSTFDYVADSFTVVHVTRCTIVLIYCTLFATLPRVVTLRWYAVTIWIRSTLPFAFISRLRVCLLHVYYACTFTSLC